MVKIWEAATLHQHQKQERRERIAPHGERRHPEVVVPREDYPDHHRGQQTDQQHDREDHPAGLGPAGLSPGRCGRVFGFAGGAHKR